MFVRPRGPLRRSTPGRLPPALAVPPAPFVPPVFSVLLRALYCRFPFPAFCRGLPFSPFSALRVCGCDFRPADGARPLRVLGVRAGVELVFSIYRVFAYPSLSLIAKSGS